jgi:hypothetical protein
VQDIVLEKIKEKLYAGLKSEPFTSTRFALELITVPRPNYIWCFSRFLKKTFLCLTHLLKNIIEQITVFDLQSWMS